MTRIQKNYEFREVEITEAHFQELSKLFESSFHNENLDTKMLDWQYQKNPNGAAVGFNAYCDQQLAAHYVCIPVKARINGNISKGLLSINTATHPEHQGQGLFTQLANKTFERGAELAYDFVVGVANQNSVYGFTKKLGFQNLGLLESRLVWHLPDVKKTDYSFSILWENNSLKWRLAHPKNRYLFKKSISKTNILAPTNRKAFYAYANQVDNELANDLNLKASPFTLLPKLWIGIDSGIHWNKVPHVKIPQKMRSTPLTLIFKNLKSNEALNSDQIRFWAHDFDAY